uniref:alpha-galactosidase n=1 Tax=termite gut metagenome TaxID=433724 RepID=S0DEQ3_9ZZZZ
MKKLLVLICLFGSAALYGQNIRIRTAESELILRVGRDNRVYQPYLGKRLGGEGDLELLPRGREAYITHGMEDYFTPALRLVHNDGNPSLVLQYVSHETRALGKGVEQTTVLLRDPAYPVEVALVYTAYTAENVITSRAEITHGEKKPVTLYNYASSMLHLDAGSYFLTEFSGDWAHEVNMSETRLDFGKKTLDTKLGSRANMFCSPMFIVSLGGPQQETSGEVILGTLGWTGNFGFTFEVDQRGSLRIVSGINPEASEYTIAKGERFTTPEFIFTYSTGGAGKASRDLHSWARNHRLKDGTGDRLTLLNNWEATYFNFDEEKLSGIMDDAVSLGVDMFLLDDGWFGNKYPRSGATQGLGDWQETRTKLPGGVRKLVETAHGKGIRFGLWIEPEMVSPKSELYEKHLDWVIRFPNRDEYYFRNQLVLDLANPAVQDYVFGIVDRLMTENPGIAYFKWDCNSPITNIYSTYLKDRQSHLYIDFVRGLYNVLDRIKAKYPDLPMMLCSGGGGRTDYKALEYFTEFWPSDNTDPLERIFIQWGYSYFFPSKSMCAHVTSWNKSTSIKFRTDVAMMCKLGFDIMVPELSGDELQYCRDAVANFDRLKPVILDGDQYRLVSPYDGQHMAVMYAGRSADKAVVFAYDMNPRYGEIQRPVRLQGLDPKKIYRIEEINRMPGSRPSVRLNGKLVSGEFLMNYGIDLFSGSRARSVVVELTVPVLSSEVTVID